MLLRALCCVLWPLVISASTPAADSPNVVVILADDLGSGDLSCYGSPENETPRLDKLTKSGAKFENFYAACAVCSPSRASLLTGRTPIRAGIYSWIHVSHKMHLRTEETTLAELLKAAGYRTCHVGKWHLGYNLEDGTGGPTPADHGFDHWMATGNNAVPSHHNPRNFVRDGKVLGKQEGYSCQLVVDEAIAWLDQTHDSTEPFYLNVWFHEPHQPVAAPEELSSRHSDTDLPDYYGSIENMDSAVGRLLDHLDSLGITDDTLIVFTSDNGSYRNDRRNNGDVRGVKGTLWEGGIRAPGLFSWPGHIEPGTIIEQPAGIVDILPTVCAAAGISAPSDRTLDGVNLLPALYGESLNRSHPLYWFYARSRPVCVIRDGDFCLIADPEIDLSRENLFDEAMIGDIKRTGLVNFRMFNLKEDPRQEWDLAEEDPQRLEMMKRAMISLHRDVVEEGFDWRTAE